MLILYQCFIRSQNTTETIRLIDSVVCMPTLIFLMPLIYKMFPYKHP